MNLHKRVAFLFITLMGIVIAGCGEDDDNGVTAGASAIDGIEFTAAPVEGFAPLTVTLSTDNPQSGMIWDFGDGSPAVVDTRRLDHTFEQAGVYTVSLTTVDEDGTPVAVTTKQITAHASVNLVVSNFAIDNYAPSAGLKVDALSANTVSATIQNTGTGPVSGSGQLHVGYYLSGDANITVDDIYIGDTTIILGSNELEPGQFGVSELGPQEEYSYVHQLAVKGNIPDGTYYAGAIVDYIDNYSWYDFPSATDTLEYSFPSHITVEETNERDNVSMTLYPVTVDTGLVRNTTADPLATCTNADIDSDDGPNVANQLVLGFANAQQHNLCFDNSDWFQFDAVAGNVYKITVAVNDATNGEIDPQLILYNQDQREILLFHDNTLHGETFDLESGWKIRVLTSMVLVMHGGRTRSCNTDVLNLRLHLEAYALPICFPVL